MKNAIINVKTESVLKKRVEQFARRTGLSLSDVVNLALRQVVNSGSLNIEEPLTPNAKTAKLFKQALADIKAGRNLSPAFSDAKEMDKYLDTL